VQRGHRLFAATVLHPAAELYAIVRALVGVSVDVAGEGGDEPAGLDSKITGDERDIQEAKGLLTRLCCDIFCVRGALSMSADNSVRPIKSKSPARGLGLSLKSKPIRRLGPVQTTVICSLEGVLRRYRGSLVQ
jgi:hypothetical protein